MMPMCVCYGRDGKKQWQCGLGGKGESRESNARMPGFFIIAEGGCEGVGGGGYQLEMNWDFGVGLASLTVEFWGVESRVRWET